jgi:hypothetical protein
MSKPLRERVEIKLTPVVGFVERKVLPVLKVGLPLLLVVFLFFSCGPGAPWLSLVRFKWLVEHRMDPVELQRWATNLIAQHPDGYGDYHPANPPPGFDRIAGYAHGVLISKGSTTSEPFVLIGGTRVDPGLMVGSPTLICTSSDVIPWKPGIYFYKAHD